MFKSNSESSTRDSINTFYTAVKAKTFMKSIYKVTLLSGADTSSYDLICQWLQGTVIDQYQLESGNDFKWQLFIFLKDQNLDPSRTKIRVLEQEIKPSDFHETTTFTDLNNANKFTQRLNTSISELKKQFPN